MGYIPRDAEWFVAELVMEITVQGADRNVVHRNLILVHADEPESAYAHALEFGQKAEASYKNPSDHLVQIRFRGISRLDVIVDPLGDGAELLFSESVGVAQDQIERWIPPKEQLAVFRKRLFTENFDPDYRSKAILDRVAMMIAKPAPDTDR
jgi:hypothetical protein